MEEQTQEIKKLWNSIGELQRHCLFIEKTSNQEHANEIQRLQGVLNNIEKHSEASKAEIRNQQQRLEILEADRATSSVSTPGQQTLINDIEQIKGDLHRVCQVQTHEQAQVNTDLGMMNDRLCRMGAWQAGVETHLEEAEKRLSGVATNHLPVT